MVGVAPFLKLLARSKVVVFVITWNHWLDWAENKQPWLYPLHAKHILRWILRVTSRMLDRLSARWRSNSATNSHRRRRGLWLRSRLSKLWSQFRRPTFRRIEGSRWESSATGVIWESNNKSWQTTSILLMSAYFVRSMQNFLISSAFWTTYSIWRTQSTQIS